MVLDYAEQANSVKLVLAEGDIEFVVAGSVTGVAPEETLDFRGREILLEATEEILAKKPFFRAAFLVKPERRNDGITRFRRASIILSDRPGMGYELYLTRSRKLG